jgi:hypothetical protein
MHGRFMKMLMDLDFKTEVQGKKLLITVNGEEKELKMFEKKLNAMKDLCEGEECGEGEGCCGGHGCC